MEDKVEASLMIEGGLTVEEVAAELGVPAPTIYGWLSQTETIQQVRDYRDEQIVAAYIEGDTINSICLKHSITQGTVYRVLHAKGVRLRRIQAPMSKSEQAEIVRMYKAGYLVTVIRRETGRSLSAIYAVLDYHNVPRRRGLNTGNVVVVPIEPG
jgi:transposase-like protein